MGTKISKDDAPYSIMSIFEDLTGLTWDEGCDDERGTYFSSDHWVSGKAIADALLEAYGNGN